MLSAPDFRGRHAFR